MHKDQLAERGTDFENNENNNSLVGQGQDILDNKQRMPAFSDAKLDNVRAANTPGISRELKSNKEDETRLVESKGTDQSKIHLAEKQIESGSYLQYTPGLASDIGTKQDSETAATEDVTRKRTHDWDKEDVAQDGTRFGQQAGIKNTSTNPGISVYGNKGDTTPPIIIELWDTSEDSTSHAQPTNQLQPIQQLPRQLTTKSNKLTAEYSREEREPTPFFKSGDISSQDKTSVGSSFLSEDYSRTEREPTPYLDANTHQRSHVVAYPMAAPSCNTLSADTPKEFHRELTPFFDNNNTRLILASPETLNTTSRHVKGIAPVRKDIAAHQNKELTSTVPLSLTVPTGSEYNRDVRESTPYYDEKNPYEYTHHPDHHFSEKKSLLVKQKSLEDDMPPAEKLVLLPPHPQHAAPFPHTVQQVSRPKLQQHLQQGITVCMPTAKPFSDKANSDQSKLRRTQPGDASLESRSPETLAPKPLRTLEVRREPPALAVPTDKSPIRPHGSTQASESGQQLGTATNQAGDSSGNSSDQTQSLKSACRIAGQQACATPLSGSRVTVSSSAVVNKSVQDSAETVNKSSKSLQDSAATVNKSSKSLQDSAATVNKSSKPWQDSAATVNKSSKSLQDSAETVNKSSKSLLDSADTVNKANKLVQGSSETISSKSSKSVQDSSRAVNKSSKSVQDSAETVHKSNQASSAAVQSAAGVSEDQNRNGQFVKGLSPQASLPQQRIQHNSQTITPLVQSKASTSQTTESVKTLDITPPPQPATDSVKVLQANRVITLDKAPLAKQMVLDDSPSVSHTSATRGQASCTPTGTLLKNNAAGHETSQPCREDITPRDVTPRQLLVSARNIYPVEIFENGSPDLPPERPETSTKKKSAASGISNAFATLFKSKRKSDDLKSSKSTKDKAKRNVFAKEGRKGKPTLPPTDLSEEMPAQQTRQDVVLSQAVKKCSPFGPYTAEGLCFLFVLTIFCLYVDMPIEKFVCYVLAAFYTFCIMRILGFLD